MRKFQAVVTAYRIAGPAARKRGLPLSALLPIHGKPSVEWVIDTLRESRNVESVTIIGPELLDELFCMRYADRRIGPLEASMEYITGILSPKEPEERIPCVIIPGEAVYMNATILDRLLEEFEKSNLQIAIPGIDSGMESAEEKKSGVVVMANETRLIPAALKELDNLLGDKIRLPDTGLTLPLLASIESLTIGSSEIGYIRSESYETAMLVFTEEELAEAHKKLPDPYSPRFSRVMVIFNPQAGKSAGLPSFFKKLFGIPRRSLDNLKTSKQYKSRIKQYLEEFGIKAEITRSKSSADAVRIARQCSDQGYDLVIAAGGDGTINSVINGLAGSQTVFGAIPLGTVNVFAIQLNLPTDLRSACEVAVRGRVKRIDLGKTGDRYFSCLAGIGFDAFVIATADTKLKKIAGAGAYIISGILNLIRYRFHRIQITVDNQPVEHSGYLAIVGNGKYYSSNIIISPLAKLDDGRLDLVILKSRNIFRLVKYLWHLRKGTLIDLPDVEYYQGKEILVGKHGHHFIHTDGEYYGRSPVRITCEPQSLKVVY